MKNLRYFKKDGTPYKNQGCHPFEQKIVYAVHMANRKDEKKYIQEFYIEFKDGSHPNGFYATKSYVRTEKPERKMIVTMIEVTTGLEHTFHWDINNLTVATRSKRSNKKEETNNGIVVWRNNTIPEHNNEKIVVEAELIDDDEVKNDGFYERFTAAEKFRNEAFKRMMKQFYYSETN